MPNESRDERENGPHPQLPVESLADYWARRDAELLADVTLIEVEVIIVEVWY